MRLSLAGPPGSGKTTQAKMLANKLSIPYLSMVGLIKEVAEQGSKLGRQMRNVIEEGGLVDDDLALKFFFDRAGQEDCRQGFIIDGGPRTLYQAERVERQLPLDKLIFVDVSLPVARERLLKRGRVDDTAEVVTHRFEVYKGESQPVVEFYKKRGKLVEVRGEGSPEEVAAEINKRLGLKG
jgi:adenylate kinase